MLARLALRSLNRNRRRTALTLFAIAFGTAMVVVAWGFGEGIAQWLVHTAVSARMGALQVHQAGYLDTMDANPVAIDFDVVDVAAVDAVDGVKATAPRIKFAAIVSTGTTSSMVQIEAIDPVRDARVCPDRYPGFVAGGPLTAGTPRAIVLGAALADSLHVKVGDSVTLMAGTRAGAQNALDFTVVGVTQGAGFLESKRVALTRYDDGVELLQMPGRAHELAIALTDPGSTHAVKRALSAVVSPRGLEAHTWQEVAPFMRDAVDRVRIVLSGVSLVLFAVVVLGVANTMLMSIFERVREIGTFLALGMTRARVLRMFVFEALVLGSVGGVVGGALGAVIVIVMGAVGVDFSPPGSDVRAVLYPVLLPTVIAGVAVAVVVGAVVASFLPARRASRLDPVEALRAL